MNKTTARESIRLLKFLQPVGLVETVPFSGKEKDTVLLNAQDGKRHLTTLKVLDILHKASLIKMENGSCRISGEGKKHLSRALNTTDVNDPEGFGAQHRKLIHRNAQVNGSTQTVTVNANESPLARLMAIKTKSGNPWLAEEAFNAAEKLRVDFTKGQFMHRVTSSWNPTSSSQSSKGSGGMVDLSDLAMDARQRVERALQIVGPELAGVLTDVCCYLKGLQAVERERSWPPRSAKLMLRVALDLLARHYGMSAKAYASKQ